MVGGGGGAGEKPPASNGVHGSGKARFTLLYGLLLYVVMPVLFLYMLVAAASPFYNPRCSPESNAAMARFVVAMPNASSVNGSSPSSSSPPPTPVRPMRSADEAPTGLRHIAFGIGASSALWKSRKEYIKLWWRPGRMRGFVWMDRPVEEFYSKSSRTGLPPIMLGVPLTRHPGFHQCDLWGDVLGLLGAHPVAPLVTLHHLDFLEPVFPTTPSRAGALRKLFDGPVRLDSAAVAQQSVCYDREHHWTVSVSWGFAVMVVRGVLSPREMETPMRSFLNWYKRADYTAYSFNTRPVARQPCQKPRVYYMRDSRMDRRRNVTVTEYDRHRGKQPDCRWRIPDPAALVDHIVVLKKPDPDLWKRSPRRNCCQVVSSPTKAGKNRTMTIEVGVCREGEFAKL
ncbi:hypothetical protein OsI_34462 [Oryza sativa Indica Group]|uniref:Uncharacterized protein n=1 Tax=Oryza sativa subsp. indica TaxID=39946 RepID=A2Z9P8_ORYSI|nr:hypothetical protein OsI_34462 [Oryza sativa Indica Group]